MNFNSVKGNIFMQLVGVEKNKDFLLSVPHTVICDMAIIYRVMLRNCKSGMYSTVITNEIMEELGVSHEQLHNTALESSPKCMPAVFSRFETLICRSLRKELQEDGLSEQEIDTVIKNLTGEKLDKRYVLCNEKGLYGAASIVYPEVLKNIARRIGGDFFLLPSSIHEMVILYDDGKWDCNELWKLVQQANETVVEVEDVLTTKVYHYNAAANELSVAACGENTGKELYLTKCV